jgi:hypothetical protein
MGIGGEATDQRGWDSVEFRIESDHLTPSDISKRLRLTPTESYQRGSAYYSEQPDGRKFDTNIWIIHRRSMEFTALTEVLDILLSRVDGIAQMSALASLSVVWHARLQVGQEYAELSPEMLEKLGKLGCGLTIAIFA